MIDITEMSREQEEEMEHNIKFKTTIVGKFSRTIDALVIYCQKIRQRPQDVIILEALNDYAIKLKQQQHAASKKGELPKILCWEQEDQDKISQ